LGEILLSLIVESDRFSPGQGVRLTRMAKKNLRNHRDLSKRTQVKALCNITYREIRAKTKISKGLPAPKADPPG